MFQSLHFFLSLSLSLALSVLLFFLALIKHFVCHLAAAIANSYRVFRFRFHSEIEKLSCQLSNLTVRINCAGRGKRLELRLVTI